jgi:hypothetical protein
LRPFETLPALIAGLGLYLLQLASPLGAAELAVMAPVLENGKPVMKAAPGGTLVPVVTRVRDGELFDGLQREAATGFTSVVLELDQVAQRLTGASAARPTWLYLSVEDGGFARLGFWLRDDGREQFHPDPFVDLVVNAATVADGGFEEIFAHEMGHVFLRRLLPGLPVAGYSRTPHLSTSITDYPTALDEGFATHFQGLVRLHTHNASLRNQDSGLEHKPLVPYWMSNIDRAARIDGVRRNWFVQAQVAAPVDATFKTRAAANSDAIARRDLSTLFDVARLKNGNQMLASEGVIATLFYRWLVPAKDERRALVDRYTRFFAALRRVDRSRLRADDAVFLPVVDAYLAMYPAETERLVGMIIDTTYGATVERAMAARVEELAAIGRRGHIEPFVAQLQEVRGALAALRGRVTKTPSLLGAALVPNIWLLEGDRSVNLNTAELEELLLLPGIDAATAATALERRRHQGLFRNLADFVARAGISPEDAARLAERETAMKKKGTFERR